MHQNRANSFVFQTVRDFAVWRDPRVIEYVYETIFQILSSHDYFPIKIQNSIKTNHFGAQISNKNKQQQAI